MSENYKNKRHTLSEKSERDRQPVRNLSSTADGITPEMLEKLRNGDYEVYNTVFFKYYAPVKNFLTALAGSREDAEEICQEVFANLWTSRARINPEKNIRAYLYTIARHESYDYLRKKNMLDTSFTDEWNEVSEGSSDDIVIAQETELLIRLAVNRMPPQRKRIFEMSRMQGLSNEEIAGKLGISKNAVEKHITFALKDVREVLSAFLVFFMCS